MSKKKIIYQSITIALIVLQSIVIFKILVVNSEQTDIMNSQKVQLQLDQLLKYEFQEMETFHNMYFYNNFDITKFQNSKIELQNKSINITSNIYLFIQDENYIPLNYSSEVYNIDFKYLKNTMKTTTIFKFTDLIIINNEIYYQSLFPLHTLDFNIQGYQLIQHKIDENFLSKLKSIMGFNIIQVRFPNDIFLLDKNITTDYFETIKNYLYKDSGGQFEIFILDEKIVCIYKSYINYKNTEDFISVYIETLRNSLSIQMIWIILFITWVMDLILSIILFIVNNIDDVFYNQEKEFANITEDIQNIYKERIANVVTKLDYENSVEYNKLNDKLAKPKKICEQNSDTKLYKEYKLTIKLKDDIDE